MSESKIKQVKVVLSKNEVSYISGMIEAHRSSLSLERNRGGNVVSREIRTAEKIERKLAAA